MPKEMRNPRLEARFPMAVERGSAPWAWDDSTYGEMVLREDGPARESPRRGLMERTARFGEAVIRFAKQIPHTPENDRLIDQLAGAGTSFRFDVEKTIVKTNPKSEVRSPKEIRIPRRSRRDPVSTSVFGFWSFFDFRFSVFGFIVCS
jgi:hypothetical protein